MKIGGLECKLLGKILPDDVINKRLREAKKDSVNRGRTLSKEKKEFLQYGLFITNIEYKLNFKNAFDLYRLRWQIELIFKTWKSILGIHKIRSARVNRVLCEVYGKLIIAALTSQLCHIIKASRNIVISYHKMLQYIKSVALYWTINIIKGEEYHISFLISMEKQIIRFCKKNKQHNKLYIEMILLDMELPI